MHQAETSAYQSSQEVCFCPGNQWLIAASSQYPIHILRCLRIPCRALRGGNREQEYRSTEYLCDMVSTDGLVTTPT